MQVAFFWETLYIPDKYFTYMFVLNNTWSKHQSEAAGAHLILLNIRDFVKQLKQLVQEMSIGRRDEEK